MALLERVATLLRANLNDLVDQAEDPEKLVKQVILDMRNQLLQVKTQVAIGMADRHVLERKRRESADKAAEWERKAELAVDKKQDHLARAALERALGYRELAEGLGQQAADHGVQVEHLRSALRSLEQKLEEAESSGDALIAQHRRARARRKANQAQQATSAGAQAATWRRMRDKINYASALGDATAAIGEESLDDQLAELERQDAVERLLSEIKQRRGLK